MVDLEHFEMAHVCEPRRETFDAVLSDGEDLEQADGVSAAEEGDESRQLTLRLTSDPGVVGNRLILLRLMSRISRDGISHS